MWQALKNAVVAAKDALGLEIPDLPVDLDALGESAATGVETVTESAAGAVQEAAAGMTESAAGVTESAAGAVDGAIAATDAVTGLSSGEAVPK